MSKAVLISIRPEWCKKIVDGDKTIEVRKTMPKLKTPFKCYIYCTYGEGLIERYDLCIPNELIGCNVTKEKTWGNCCNGKVIGEFVCDKIIETVPWRIKGKTGFLAKRTEDEASLPQRSCLTIDEIVQYAGSENRCIYGWHISDLVVYDKPRELTEFYKNGTLSNEAFCETVYDGKRSYADYLFTRAVRKPPQSWCFVEG